MNEITYGVYLQKAFQHYADMEGGVRVGQALMNVLWECNEKLHRTIPMDVDCFYVDELVANFLIFVEANWNC
jgi:hypothetical protein